MEPRPKMYGRVADMPTRRHKKSTGQRVHSLTGQLANSEVNAPTSQTLVARSTERPTATMFDAHDVDSRQHLRLSLECEHE